MTLVSGMPKHINILSQTDDWEPVACRTQSESGKVGKYGRLFGLNSSIVASFAYRLTLTHPQNRLGLHDLTISAWCRLSRFHGGRRGFSLSG